MPFQQLLVKIIQQPHLSKHLHIHFLHQIFQGYQKLLLSKKSDLNEIIKVIKLLKLLKY